MYALLHPSGACFLRTDQMDGETDWKLRLTVAACQRLPCDAVSELKSDRIRPCVLLHYFI